MRTRKGFRRIIVDGVEYLYAVSLSTHKIVVYQGDQRFEWLLPEPDAEPSTSWRGKHGDGGFGKREIAKIIHKHSM
jgi:hypothetical protein